MVAWTRTAVAHRRAILVGWLVLFVLGGVATSNLGKLLTNRFSVPGSQAERGLDILRARFHERGDGAFTLVVQSTTGGPHDLAAAHAAAARAAARVPGGRAEPPQPAAPGVVYIQIPTPLQSADAKNYTPAMRAAIGRVPGARTFLTGFPAITYDEGPVYGRDLRKGETIAVPIAVAVLLFMLGTVGAIVVPLLFALATIPTTLGLVWVFAHLGNMAQYVTNIVTLIGFAIAIDYSMLIVFRFREELARGSPEQQALETTMATAGRATLFSGLTVAIGLGLLIAMPLPFMRSMGAGGVLIPLVSMLASATLLPALLSLLGQRVNRVRLIPRGMFDRRVSAESGFWTRLAGAIMRRPIVFLLATLALMVGLALPATELNLTAGDSRGYPSGTEAVAGLHLLERLVGPGALAPNQLVVETGRAGGVYTPATAAAVRRFVGELRSDPRVEQASILAPVYSPPELYRAASLVDADSSTLQIRAAGYTDSGTFQAIDLAHRIRNVYVPRARFPASDTVLLTGAPAYGIDFIDKSFAAFPWLILAVLVLSFLVLTRAFRSIVLPLKAVLLNLLSVSATYGVLVLFFQHGWGTGLGFQRDPQVEGWIPVFLFATLFGLSMDYEVFMLTRMREEWDKTLDNELAVARGLEHTGRIITAAAVVMIAAFSGFMSGSFVGLQEFGLGLAAAIFLDATIVRALLVPAAMKLLGRWNWYLPERVRRALRVPAAPLPTSAPRAPQPVAG